MPNHPNQLIGVVASNIVNATAPATPTAPSVTNSCTNAVFTWTAPADNGAAITKYGYQTSTNGGSTWSAETETQALSVTIGNQYSATAYNVRVRAFNSIGWGSYSTASSANTVWTYSAYNADYQISRGCSAGCNNYGGGNPAGSICGSQSGTEYGTQARTCYQWTKAGCTSLTGQGCTLGGASYSGTCSGMSGCGTWQYADIAGNSNPQYIQNINGGDYRWLSGTYWWTDSYSQCCGCDYNAGYNTEYNVVYCTTTGEKRWWAVQCFYLDP